LRVTSGSALLPDRATKFYIKIVSANGRPPASSTHAPAVDATLRSHLLRAHVVTDA
jgi:hypothetical protein